MQDDSSLQIERPTTQDLECAIRTILKYFDNPEREGLIDTPARVIKAYKEILQAEEPKIALFSSNGYNLQISVKKIWKI